MKKYKLYPSSFAWVTLQGPHYVTYRYDLIIFPKKVYNFIIFIVPIKKFIRNFMEYQFYSNANPFQSEDYILPLSFDIDSVENVTY